MEERRERGGRERGVREEKREREREREREEREKDKREWEKERGREGEWEREREKEGEAVGSIFESFAALTHEIGSILLAITLIIVLTLESTAGSRKMGLNRASCLSASIVFPRKREREREREREKESAREGRERELGSEL
jgi:hypothetical protein